MSKADAPDSRIRVLIVDDHTAVRAGIRMVIESNPHIEAIGDAGNSRDALALAAREQPDVILLDLDLDGESGVEMIPHLTEAARSARILILTGVRDVEQHQAAVRSGAMGLVMKDIPADLLIKAIERVHTGELWLDRSTTANLIAGMRHNGEEPHNQGESCAAAKLTER